MKKKELLTRIAVDLFAKRGFSGTSIRDIAKAAKNNVALIYYYFKDKEEILYDVMQRSFKDLIVILKEIQLQEKDPFECLKKMIIQQVLYASRSWEEAKLIIIESDSLHGRRKSDCQKLQREIYDIYMTQLQKMKEVNCFGDVNPTVVNFTIFGTISWFYRWYTEGKPLSEEEVANEMVKILQYGILNTNL